MSDAEVALRFVFYNLQEGRMDDVVQKELEALSSLEPQVLCGCEAVGYVLPKLPGYHRVRDRTTKSKANIFAYFPDDRPYEHVWHKVPGSWPKTKHPGQHPPRSFLELHIEQVHVIVGQQAPITAYAPTNRDTIASQKKGAEILTGLLSSGTADQPTLALCEWNDVSKFVKKVPPVVPRDRPTAETVARSVEGIVVGLSTKVDKAVVRNVGVNSVSYPTHAGPHKVPLRSDHKDALLLDVAGGSQWWPPKATGT